MMTNSQFFEIAQDLEVFHGIFSRLWQMGKPIEDTSISTAAVRFDKDGGLFSFCFNPKFLESLDYYTLKFVICHEALHVLLNHGLRGRGLDKNLANRAMDVVINESLVKDFGFIRDQIKFEKEWCWYDTVFQPEDKILKEKSFEYYYDILYNKASKNPSCGKDKDGNITMPKSMGGEQKTVDDHEGFGSESQDEIDEKVDEAVSELGPEERGELKDIAEKLLDEQTKKNLQAGTGIGGLVKTVSIDKVPTKRKWETVIKRWSLKYLNKADKNIEQWARTNRRFVTLSKELLIPTEMETDFFEKEKTRIKVVFFLDTSGSCAHLADRFFKAAKSLPEEKFEIHLCCFDTRVYETSLKTGKLYGFGGTSFNILEEYVQKYTKEKNKGKYPDAMFVITDGYGNNIKPQYPKNWFWFLSENYTACIPKECNILHLKDYE